MAIDVRTPRMGRKGSAFKVSECTLAHEQKIHWTNRTWKDSIVPSSACLLILEAICILTCLLPDQHEVLPPQNYDECLSVIEPGARKRKARSKIHGYLSDALATQRVPQSMSSSLSGANILPHEVRSTRSSRKVHSRTSESELKLNATLNLSDDDLDVMEAAIRFFRYCRTVWHETGVNLSDSAIAVAAGPLSETGRTHFDFDDNSDKSQPRFVPHSDASQFRTIWKNMPPVPIGYIISDRQVQPGQPPAWGIFEDRAEPLPIAKSRKQEATHFDRTENPTPSENLTCSRIEHTENSRQPSSQKIASHPLTENIPPLPQQLTAPPSRSDMLHSGGNRSNSARILASSDFSQVKPNSSRRLRPSSPLALVPRPPSWQFKLFDPTKGLQR